MKKETIYHAPNQNCYTSRTLCGVLDEMRQCYKTRNFAPLLGLIEEAQTYGNRMEAKLYDVEHYERMRERYKQLRQKVKELEKATGAEPSHLGF